MVKFTVNTADTHEARFAVPDNADEQTRTQRPAGAPAPQPPLQATALSLNAVSQAQRVNEIAALRRLRIATGGMKQPVNEDRIQRHCPAWPLRLIRSTRVVSSRLFVHLTGSPLRPRPIRS